MKNWRVRSRLLLLVGAPTLAACVIGGFSIGSSIGSAQAYHQVHQLADLAGDVTNLVQALQNEREDTVTFITMAGQGGRVSALSARPAARATADPELMLLQADYAATSRSAGRVRSLAASIRGGSYPALARQQAEGAITAIANLPALRQAAVRSKLPAEAVIDDYAGTITQLLTLENDAAAGSNDASLADNVRVLSLISSMKEEAAEEQAILTSALRPDLVGATRLGAEQLSVLNQQEAEQAANLSAFTLAATAAQRQAYNSALSSPLVARAQQQVQQATSLLASGATSPTDPTFAVAADDASFTIASLRSVEQQLISSVIGRSGALQARAIAAAAIEAILVLVVLALALLLITVVGRSMTRPLRRLRSGALEIAGVRLPQTVRLMSETDGAGVSLDVEPIDVDSADEIGEVARAFDQVHREALRLAANEAALRGNVNAMFVNLSRRSQSLVERQIRLIDSLEQGEQDSERLASLFQMDHLATRMRRNSENLLVLAGHDVSRRWTQPVTLVDVLRAAVSEIEQYERVSLNIQPGIAVRGQAVSDVVHLLSELAENATSFSSADTPVSVSGHLLSSGGVLLDITDQGVSMGAEEMAHANWRLDNPPVVDVAVSRRMGLFVVARLAARHGIRVRLRPAAGGGLTALVWLPEEAVTHDASAVPVAGPRRTDLASGPDVVALGGGSVDNGSGGFDRRTFAEDEVAAARAPKLASPRAQPGETTLGPRRVPGTTGSGPGSAWGATGLMPALSAGPEHEVAGASDPAVTSSQPAIDVGQPPEVSYAAPGPSADSGPGPETVEPPASSGADAEPQLAEPEVSQPPKVPETLLSALANGGSGRAGSQLDGLTSPAWGASGGADGETGGADDEVIVPSVHTLAQENRLPIFEAVESDWFRRGRSAVGWVGQVGDRQAAPANGWASPADEGWRAAEAVQAPSSAGTTPAGLPKRVPQANLVPGAAPAVASPGPGPAVPAPVRSAVATRERFASFQRGAREGRAARRGTGEPDGEDATS